MPPSVQDAWIDDPLTEADWIRLGSPRVDLDAVPGVEPPFDWDSILDEGGGRPARSRVSRFEIRTAKGRTIRLDRVLAAAREAGIELNPFGARRDPEMLAMLANAFHRPARPATSSNDAERWSAPSISGLGAGPVGVGGFHPSLAEEDLPPDERFGVSEGLFGRTVAGTLAAPPWSFQDSNDTFGSFIAMLTDLHAGAMGCIRRAKQCDIYWGAVFPQDETNANFFQNGERIPDPVTMQASMEAGSRPGEKWRRLWPQSMYLFWAYMGGMKVTLTPFNAGGGMDLNVSLDANGGYRTPNQALSAGGSWPDVMGNRMPWQRGVFVESTEGWGEIYHDFSVSGGPLPPSLGAGYYQQYALNVWPTDPGSGFPYVDPYHLECARRKSQGVAAFSWKIGEWLQVFERIVQQGDPAFAIHDVVDSVELCNESSGSWVISVNAEAIADPNLVTYGQLEMGRFQALLAGPLRQRFPTMKFRYELPSWHGLRGDAERLTAVASMQQWLSGVITLGLVSEVAWWKRIQQERRDLWRTGAPLSTPVAEWIASGDQLGWHWPPDPLRADGHITFDASDLLHQAGFHWFHDSDSAGNFPDGAASWGYADQVRLLEDVTTFAREVVAPAHAAGFSLRQTVGAIRFPALSPADINVALGSRDKNTYYLNTTDDFQGGMLVRMFATLRAANVERIAWFPYLLAGEEIKLPLAPPPAGVWQDSLMALGLRNDAYPFGTSLERALDLWPRSAWFAARRLAWLFNAVGDGNSAIVERSRGLVVIRMNARRPISRAPDGTPLKRAWGFIYLFWLDQYGDERTVHPTWTKEELRNTTADLVFAFGDPADYQFLPLVPRVTPSQPRSSRSQGPAGYAEPASVDWSERGVHSALVSITDGPFLGTAVTSRVMTIQKADPVTAPMPLCMFTNGQYVWRNL